MDHIPQLKLVGPYGIHFKLGDKTLKVNYLEFVEIVTEAIPEFKMELPQLSRTRPRRRTKPRLRTMPRSDAEVPTNKKNKKDSTNKEIENENEWSGAEKED